MIGVDQFTHRLDVGFGNPNKSACLFVETAIVSSYCNLLGWKHRGLCLAVALACVAGLCLTGSRGGVAALVVGGACVAFGMRRQFGKLRVLLFCCCCLIFWETSCYVGAGNRVYNNFFADPSVLNRLAIWKYGVRMLVDANWGWGFGKSGDAFMQWYQGQDRLEIYRTLVNSHLTWLVEGGWLFRAGYLFFWPLMLLLPLSGKPPGTDWVAVGVWSAFGAAALFSSVAEEPGLWVIPGVCLLLTIIRGQARSELKGKVAIAAVSSAVLLSVLYMLGKNISMPVSVKKTYYSVLIPAGAGPRFWILAPDRGSLGLHFGHEIRASLQAGRGCFQRQPCGWGICELSQLTHLRTEEHLKLILSNPDGETLRKISNSVPNVERLFFISTPNELVQTAAAMYPHAQVFSISGDFYGEKLDLKSGDETNRTRVRSIKIPGCSEYVPDWASIVLRLDENYGGLR